MKIIWKEKEINKKWLKISITEFALKLKGR